MLVSVIMNGHNAERYVAEAIETVLAQSYEKFELVFFDNCSSDATGEIVKQFKDSRIKYIRSESFLTLGEARNLAISSSAGDLIAFLDTDDLWLPTKLELQVPVFSDPNIGIVISDTLFFNDDRDVRQPFKYKKPPTGKVFRYLLQNYFISLETAVVRRSALQSLDHMFDPRFQVIEEYDLFVRLSYEWELGYVDEVLGKWRMHSASWTWSKSEFFLKERIIFMDKLYEVIPSFNSLSYPHEIRCLERKVDWDTARLHWKKGEHKKTRALMSQYKFDSAKWFAVYSLCFLPFSFFQAISSKIGRIAQ